MKKLICIILFSLLLTANVGQAQFSDSEPMFGQILNLGHWSTDGLVFYWRGIEDKKVRDESYYGNDGTITEATWVGDGLYWTEADADNKIDIGAISNLGNNYSIVFDNIRLDTAGASDQGFWIYWPARGTVLRMATTTELWFFRDFDNTDGVYEITVSFPYYHHFVITCTDSTDKPIIYVDGVPVTVTVITPAVGNVVSMNNDSLIIGNHPSNVRSIDGSITGIKIYNRVLSASEIAALDLNPNLPMQRPPIWLFKAPVAPPSGIIPIIQAHTRRRRAG